jgi:hypothetical protein
MPVSAYLHHISGINLYLAGHLFFVDKKPVTAVVVFDPERIGFFAVERNGGMFTAHRLVQIRIILTPAPVAASDFQVASRCGKFFSS